MIRGSVNNFPASPYVKDGAGLPWSIVVTPFADTSVPGALSSGQVTTNLRVPVDKVARCGECYAYINPYAGFHRARWRCALCQHYNDISERYDGDRSELPELVASVIDYDVSVTPPPADAASDPLSCCPVYVAVVDLSGSADFVRHVASGLMAAVETLPDTALFAMLTFSNRLGVFDFASPEPSLRLIPLPAEREAVGMALEELVPLQRAAALVGTHRSRILAAIDTLEDMAVRRKYVTDLELEAHGFGGTLDAALEWFCDFHDLEYVHMMTFLAGNPSHGLGDLSEDDDLAFYNKLAGKAADNSVCIDVYILSDDLVEARNLKLLSSATGGAFVLYESESVSPLPQDIYRQFTDPHQAFKCMLRVRTSSEFQPAGFFGNMHADDKYDNLYKMTHCDSYSTISFDFAYDSNAGLGGYSNVLPCVQLAFAYTQFDWSGVADTDDDGDMPATAGGEDIDSAMQTRAFPLIRRRLRVITMQFSIAQTPADMYEYANADVVMAVMMRKVVAKIESVGLAEARLLLQDWLINLILCYNEHVDVTLPPGEDKSLDVTFSKHEKLQQLPRLVFALLKSPAMRPNEVERDERVFYQMLMSSVPPAHLLRLLYPSFSGYADPDTLVHPTLALSHQSLVTTALPLYLLDAFTHIYLYYTRDAVDKLKIPFLPPSNTLLRNTLNALKRDRPLTPILLDARQGGRRASVFDSYMIEDGVANVKGPSGMTLAQWLAWLATTAAGTNKASR